MYRRYRQAGPRAPLAEQFAIRSREELLRDVRHVLGHLAWPARATGNGAVNAVAREGFVIDPSSLGHFRPFISVPAYLGFVPRDGLSPIMNYFDRFGGGRGFHSTVTKRTARDYRGGRLTYDEHDGTDFACPPQMPVVAAAPGVLVARRRNFLRGGLTACVDHGGGVVTQYTHLTRVLADVGEPLRRGEAFALSGTGGLDMLSGFPWVPPHVHFMVWIDGVPVDPFRGEGDATRTGTWRDGNAPRPSDSLADDRTPLKLADVRVDERAVNDAIGICRDERIRTMIEESKHAATRLALLEDSLHHDRAAWPAGLFGARYRLPADAPPVRLTLPLPASEYRGARAADSMFTRP